MLTSLQSAGHVMVENSPDCDAAIIWSVLWAGRMQPNQQVWSHYREQGRPVIVADVGALVRGKTWKIAVNHITAQGYYGHTENLDLDRPAKLGIRLHTTTSANPAILIACQHANSLQMLGHGTPQGWAAVQVKQLRQVTDRPVVVRPHPRSRFDLGTIQQFEQQAVVVETPVKLINTYDSFDMTVDYHAVVNLNSGPGSQAAIAGTRPVVDSTSLAYPVGVTMNELEQPYQVDRAQWLVEICHTEYTIKEIAKGIWINRLKL
jgi:hypothetical protein